MKKWLNRLKSNKGFTMEDVIVAMVILALFASTIGGTFVTVYQIQGETRLTAVATSYAIKILENIDKIGYEEVKNGMEESYKSKYDIPNAMDLKIEVNPYNTEGNIKQINLTITYEFSGKTNKIFMEKLKAQEI